MVLDPRIRGEMAWLTSFGDLIGILLANFVLLFSMSSLDEKNWRGVAPARATLGAVAADGSAVVRGPDGGVPGAVPPAGASTDYLYALLRAALAEVQAIGVIRSGEAVLLRVPAAGAGTSPDHALRAVAAVLAPLPNVVEALGCAGADLGWDRALADATTLAGRLRAAGLGREMAVLAVADPALCASGDGLLRVGAERD